jgi:Lrp/AsnC family transcriptional regulator
MKLDETDRALLRLLQSDATIPLDSLATRVSVSANTCWRRVKRLEEAGIIRARVALLDPEALGLSQVVFVAIKTNDHSLAWLEKFAAAVAGLPEVVEFHRMAGEVDYLLKLMVADVRDYDRVYRKLIASVEIADVSATFAMECIKNTTELPV